MDRLGFIGLGLMGTQMTKRLLAGGYQVTVWNRTAEKAKPVLDAGAKWADSAKAVAAQSDVVITMVTDSHACEEVCCGPNGILDAARPGLVILDMSSITPDTSKEIAGRAEAVGVEMLDAPVAGSWPAAAKGDLGIMVGGKREVFDRCLAVLQQLGSKITFGGDHGAGTTLKIINNLVLNCAVEAACEALTLAAKLGIDPAMVIDVTSVGGAKTFAMQSRGPRILERDFAARSSINTQWKDLTNAIRLAEQAKVPLPVASAVREIYQAARAQGKGDLDTAAIITIFEQLADVTVASPGAAK